MSVSVGSMSAGLGLDLSEFQNGMQRATELARSNSTLMSAELKRTSREGAESLRLIDESLGIHMSRPLTRILTQEFPALAAGLQTLLGGAVFGAVATIGVEAFEKVVRSIEKAQKAQEEWKKAIEKSEETIQSVGDTFARKIAEANGISAIAKEAMAGAEEAKKGFDQVAAAIDNENKKAEEATGLWTRFKASVGDFFHQQFTFESTLKTEDLKAQLGTLKTEIDNAFRMDALHGTHDAMKVFQDDLGLATQKLKELQALQSKQQQNTAFAFDVPGHKEPKPAQVMPEQLAAVQQWVDLLNRAIGIEKDRDALEKANLASVARAEAVKQELVAQEKIAALYKEMGSSLAKLQPEMDPIKKLDAEIAGFRSTAEANFREIGRSAASALATSAGLAGLLSYEKKLDELKIKLEGDILAKQALDLLNKPLPGGQPTGTSVPGLAAPASVLPTLGAGGTAAAQFDVFAGDRAAQLKAAAAAYADLLTPVQKYQIAQQELNLLLQKGLIDQTAYTAALQKAGEEMALGSDKLEKLLKKTGDASAGMQAFFLQMQKDANRNGAFTFDILNKGLQGFEDNTIAALTGGKAQWRSYFDELVKMALKFELNKLLTGGLTGLQHLFGGGGQQAAATTQATAATIMQTAAATQLAAANIMAASGMGGATGGAGGFNPLSLLAFSGGLAGGGDLTPGSSYVVGEQGPEPLSVDQSGRSFISPHSSLSSSGGSRGDMHVYIDAKGAELGVEEKIVRALTAAKPRFIGEAVANFSEIQRRSVQK
jgi:lambda family phage tail tape measure protein